MLKLECRLMSARLARCSLLTKRDERHCCVRRGSNAHFTENNNQKLPRHQARSWKRKRFPLNEDRTTRSHGEKCRHARDKVGQEGERALRRRRRVRTPSDRGR
ncbi:unnamed protein product [Ixodes persulcatus]